MTPEINLMNPSFHLFILAILVILVILVGMIEGTFFLY